MPDTVPRASHLIPVNYPMGLPLLLSHFTGEENDTLKG